MKRRLHEDAPFAGSTSGAQGSASLVALRAAGVLMLLALAMIAASLPMEPFNPGPDGGYPMFAVAQGDFQAYAIAREQALTAKFVLQDYGTTLLICSLAFAALRRRMFTTPRSFPAFVALAVAAPLISAGAMAFDLFQGQARWVFPPWSDSLALPLMGIPVIVISGLTWAFGHITLLPDVPWRPGVCLSLSALQRGPAWLRVTSLLTSAFAMGMAAEGAYWYVLASGIWLYFYASIASLRTTDPTPHSH